MILCSTGEQLTNVKKDLPEALLLDPHHFAYCCNDARVIKWIWENVKRGFRGGVRSFEDYEKQLRILKPALLPNPEQTEDL